MYNDIKASEGDNPTIGIILCTEKDETIVKYSVLAENKKLFASKYRLYLPKEEELAQLIETDRQYMKLIIEKTSEELLYRIIIPKRPPPVLFGSQIDQPGQGKNPPGDGNPISIILQPSVHYVPRHRCSDQ